MSTNLEYLFGLETPYFIGVVDRTTWSMRLYEATDLPRLFATHDVFKMNWSLIPIAEDAGYPQDQSALVRNGVVRVGCREVLTVSLKDNERKCHDNVSKLIDVCRLGHRNITARAREQRIYPRLDGQTWVLAGPGSELHSRRNSLCSLAEVFFNLERLVEIRSRSEIEPEFRVLADLYEGIQTLGWGIPAVLSDRFEALRSRVEDTDR